MDEEINENVTEGMNKAENINMTLKQKARLVALTLLAIIIIAFVSQNYDRIRVDFLFWTFQVRLIVVILLSTVFGGAMMYLFTKYRAAKKKKKFK